MSPLGDPGLKSGSVQWDWDPHDSDSSRCFRRAVWMAHYKLFPPISGKHSPALPAVVAPRNLDVSQPCSLVP